MKKTAIAVVLLVLFAAGAGGAGELRILSPRNGWSLSRVVNIRGQAPSGAKTVHLVCNGIPMLLPVLPPGTGRIRGGLAETIIRMAALHQLAGVLLVDFPPFRLAVRAIIAAHIGTLVPIQAQPTQGPHQFCFRFRHITFLVGILDPQNKLPPALASQQIII